MKKFIEKLIGRLEEKKNHYLNDESTLFELGKQNASNYCSGKAKGINIAIEIVNQLAEEYNGGWISSDVDLPKENGWYWGYYVTASYIGADGVKHTECKYASIYWEDNLWLYDPRSFRTVDEVIAWKSIAPYQPKGE